MTTDGIIVLCQHPALLLVRHADGFTVVELDGGKVALTSGDRIRANWKWAGRGGIVKDGVEHMGLFHRGCRKSDDAYALIDRIARRG